MFKNILSSLKKSSFWNEKFQKAWILPTLARLKQNGHKSKGLFDKILFPTTFLKCHHLTVPLLATTENSRTSSVIPCHIKKKKIDARFHFHTYHRIPGWSLEAGWSGRRFLSIAVLCNLWLLSCR